MYVLTLDGRRWAAGDWNTMRVEVVEVVEAIAATLVDDARPQLYEDAQQLAGEIASGAARREADAGRYELVLHAGARLARLVITSATIR